MTRIVAVPGQAVAGGWVRDTVSAMAATQEPEQIRTGRGEFCKNMIIDYYAFRIIFVRIYVK